MAPAPHETPPDGELSARRRRAALNFRAGALVILAATGISVLGPGPVGALVGLHVGWALWVAGVGELLVRGLVGERHAGVISTVGGLVFLPALLLVSGQAMQAPLALALLVLPLFIAAIAPADRLALWAASVGCIAWAALGGVWRGEPWTQVVAAVATTVCSSAVAAWGSVVYRRTEAARARAVEAHLEAARKLAETEQRTARAEQFALIGQMAANIAHHVNSPLAFVGANVRFVAAQLGSQPTADAEVLAALAESNEGLVRIGSLVRELQSFARDERPRATAADVGEAVARVTHRLRSTLKPEAAGGGEGGGGAGSAAGGDGVAQPGRGARDSARPRRGVAAARATRRAAGGGAAHLARPRWPGARGGGGLRARHRRGRPGAHLRALLRHPR